MIMAGDANVWHPHFNLGRTRSVDALIIPFVDLLASSCGLGLCNPRDQATHLAGAALDLVFISSPCEAVVRVHDGVSCCSEVPSCCPLLGSDHFLCVAATQLTCRPPPEAGPCLPPLRDWCPTLCSAYSSIIEWSRDVHSLLWSVAPTDEDRRLSTVDAVYEQLLSILMWHAPSQFRLRRRRQPSWWTPACMAACIARNGAWRDHRRSQSPEDRARFSAARMAFHRVVRSAQRAYWTQWQDCVSTLSLSNPRQAASAVRRAFQGTNRDVSSQVRWPASSHPLPVEESLAHWRDHFATVGASPDASYDEDFFRLTGRRFAEISSSCRSAGIFDALFTHSELRRAHSHCIDSAVGLDSLPYSLFKVNFPWWQDAILNFFNLVFSWSAVPTLWKRSVIVPVFKRGDPSQATNYRPISLASCFFKVLEHMVLSRIGPHICPQLDE